ncbi:DUF1254 domain-containing protein [Paraburkholderia tagetis]|uniref:DUF1254 domain-containing protein n=1 Tax=Paraburkholderia tagetis TaxID=2913261 RepID=A0A9X1RU43_9BURK|nr:DUF1254 domain-containing protein [Paraburkholderia tagetis]MCG5076146.1 DUF1254 domain-containing protein [Paraburkholderia tagetis]
MKKRFTSIALLLVGASCALGFAVRATAAAPAVSPEEVRAIARDAYIYGYPVIDNYRIQYSYFADKQSPEYKGPWNTIHNSAHVYTPDDKAMQTPNSDTPYSQLGADLRAEPVVISVPEIEKNRYYSLQFIDMYTFNFAYAGTRTTGNQAGSFLLAGPNWHGATPPGIKKVLRSETDFAFVFFRTQLFSPQDIGNVRKIQAGYKVQTLSAYLGQPAPPAAPAIDFAKPLSEQEQRSSLEAFNLMGYVLQFCPPNPSEKPLMERFARIDVGAGKKIDFAALSPQMKQAFHDGIADAWQTYQKTQAAFVAGKISSGDVFGTRAVLKNNYAYRMYGDVAGIYGNSADEAIYLPYNKDQTGADLSGAHHYALHFGKGQLPPVHAFWSLTLYELPSQLLVANPLHRYLINSPMLPDLKKDADGGITLYIQHDSPGKDKESNWLPAPEGPFAMVLRTYWPDKAMLDGQWHAPQLHKTP